MSQSLPRVALALLVAGLTACEQQAEIAAPTDTVLAAVAETQGAVFATVRAGTARYHRVEAALEDGYTRVTACIFNTPGGRGHVFANFGLIDGTVDPARPELLVYEPTRQGTYRLVAVGFLVPAPAWDPFHSGPPALGDQPFVDRRTPPFGADFPNYALFAWVWRHNPIGMYAFYNPNVSCEFADVAEMR